MTEAERNGLQVDLERSATHLLHRALQHALDIYVAATGSGGPTQRQFAVLAAVAQDEGLTQTDLVRATGIDRSTLAELVARMIDKGLLARKRSSSDARANTVRLTRKGRSQLAAAAPKVAAADEEILNLLPIRGRTSFLAMLLKLSQAVEREEAEAAPEATEKPPKKKAKGKTSGKADKKKKKARKG